MVQINNLYSIKSLILIVCRKIYIKELKLIQWLKTVLTVFIQQFSYMDKQDLGKHIQWMVISIRDLQRELMFLKLMMKTKK